MLTNDNAMETSKRGARRTLVRVLEETLRLTHPFMPFITEEIWQIIAPLAGKEGDSIMNQPYPITNESEVNKTVVSEMEWIMNFVIGVRSIRSQMNISPKKRLSVILKDGQQQDIDCVENNYEILSHLSGLESVKVLKGKAPTAATALVGKMNILIPLEGLIDKDAEIRRLNKEISKLKKLIGQSSGKLNNKNYAVKAPAKVVRRERNKLTEMERGLSQLQQQRRSLV